VVSLVSGEIADDIAAYLANSEQIPSVVALGEVVETGAVRAGGLIAQVLPGAEDDAIAHLERNAKGMEPLTQQLARGVDPEGIVDALCAGLVPKRLRDYDVLFACQCTREKVEAALLSLGRDELVKMAAERPETEATCEFCKRTYILSAAEVEGLAARTKGGA
jgi:molecular chaperone Hsp33